MQPSMLPAAEDVEAACEAACSQLSDPKHLVRERALKRVVSLLQQPNKGHDSGPNTTVQHVWAAAHQLLAGSTWEARLGGLAACKALAQHQPAAVADQLPSMLTWCISLLEDSEPRVRSAVAELLGVLSQQYDCGLVWRVAGPSILDSIYRNFVSMSHTANGQAGNLATACDLQWLDRDALIDDVCSTAPRAAAASNHPPAAAHDKVHAAVPHENVHAAAGTAAGVEGNGHVAADVVNNTACARTDGKLQQQKIAAAAPPLQGNGTAAVTDAPGQQVNSASAGVENCSAQAVTTGKLLHNKEASPQDSTSATRGREADQQGDGVAVAALAQSSPPSLVATLLNHTYKPLVPGQGDLRHGTEGWRCLESSLKAVLAIAQGGGSLWAPYMTKSLLDLVCRCMHHQNRYVREASHLLVAALCEVLQPAASQPCNCNSNGSSIGVCSMSHGVGHANKALFGTPEATQRTIISEPVTLSEAPSDRTVSLQQLAVCTAGLLADGLTDNWSQVRYPACLGTRALLLAIQRSPQHDSLMPQVLPVLLPPLCLNRYYVADGVRSAAQETWRKVMQDCGRAAVAQYIDQVCSYYIAQSKAVHHGVREAACACIAELAEKIDSCVVVPHMPDLLRALLVCCKDMAWPVRDAGCVAAGRCARALPAACKPFLQQYMQLWIAHLWDNVQSVRANSAAALMDALVAYPEDATVLDAIHTAIRELLPKVLEQQQVTQRGRTSDRSAHSSKHPTPSGTTDVNSPAPSKTLPTQPDQIRSGEIRQIESGVHGATRSAGRTASSSAWSGQRTGMGRPRTPSPSRGRPQSPARLLEQDIKAALAANPELFSCGADDMDMFSENTAQRFSTSSYVRGDGCMDFGFSREQEPWEATDGATFLVAELACVRPQEAVQHLEGLVTFVAGAAGFEAADKLRETLWRVFPRIARALGKQTLKRHLELFLPAMFHDLNCGAQLTEVAAGKAVAALRDYLGPNILAARLTDSQAHMLRTSPAIPPGPVEIRM